MTAQMIHPMAVDSVWEEAVMTGGRGCRLTTADGRTLLDGLGGLQNVNVGYGRDEVVDAGRKRPCVSWLLVTSTMAVHTRGRRS